MAKGGLQLPYATAFGDPETVDIMSARLGEVVPVDAVVDDGVVTAVMPAGTQALELSVENTGDVAARVRFIVAAGTVADASAIAEDGLVRRVPVGSQFIEFRRAIAGDTLIVDTLAGEVVVTVHAHVEAS